MRVVPWRDGNRQWPDESGAQAHAARPDESLPKNNGVFPAARVHRIIEGRDVDSHGNREMPIWGDVFKAGGDRLAREATSDRIDAIVSFLESIQRRKA
jgi:hypothetical protein